MLHFSRDPLAPQFARRPAFPTPTLLFAKNKNQKKKYSNYSLLSRFLLIQFHAVRSFAKDRSCPGTPGFLHACLTCVQMYEKLTKQASWRRDPRAG